MKTKDVLIFLLKTIALSLLMLIALTVAGLIRPLPTGEAEVQDSGKIMVLLFIVTTVYALVMAFVITCSRGNKLQLILGLIFAFYGVQTVVGQIEAIFFLTPLGENWGAGSVTVMQMPLDFIVSQFIIWGMVAIVGVPVAVYLFGRKQQDDRKSVQLIPKMKATQWVSKIVIVILAYELLYFGFGYFVAWKDPGVQAFYQGTDPGSFFAQMHHVATQTPGLPVLQAFRAILWMAFILPVIGMLRHQGWPGAVLTALFISLPMNIPHIIPNPYMPAEVRMVHFIETLSSMFVFGILLFWIFKKPNGN